VGGAVGEVEQPAVDRALPDQLTGVDRNREHTSGEPTGRLALAGDLDRGAIPFARGAADAVTE